jgi:hypothetical protein
MRLDSTHPGKTTLLAWSEGELWWWRSWLVGRHVRSCWQCKGQVSELEAIVCAVSLDIDRVCESSRVDTAKAYWRFRQTCLELDEAPQARRLRLRPAWAIAAAVALATAGLAYVTNWPRFRGAEESPVSIPRRAPSPLPSSVVPNAPVDTAFERVRPAASLPSLQLPGERAPALPLGPADEDLLATEIQALAALHRSRFCLHADIAVRRVGSMVEITGVVQSKDQRDRITGVLEGIGPAGIMRVRLDDPTGGAAAISTAGNAQSGAGPAGKRTTPLAVAWLRESLGVGSRLTEREMFSLMSSVVLESESVSSEAWAIRHLAEQFPLGRTRRLSPELSDQLLQMVDDHAIVLANSLLMLQGRLHPLLGKQPAQSGNAWAPWPDEPWQGKVLALQQRAEGVVSQLLESFSADAGAGSLADSGAMRDLSALLSLLDGKLRDCMAFAGDLRASIQTQSAKAR